MLKALTLSTALNTRSVHHSTGHGHLFDNFAIRCQDNRSACLRLDCMARSRRQARAPCPPLRLHD